MDITVQSAVIATGAVLAGFLGALTGLGGGVIIVPMLTLLLGVDIHYAIGASLISVIATSSGAASAYVKEGFTNMRIGMFLEVATVIGALIGALIAPWIPVQVIAVLFGLILLHAAYNARKPLVQHNEVLAPDPKATFLRLNGRYPTVEGTLQSYNVQSVPSGFGLMMVAGTLSGLLGIGSGALKVIAMDRIMKIPFKVSTTTSNFMIGVTAAASAGVYLHRGYIVPELAMPVMLGVLIGSLTGSVVLTRVRTRYLRVVFSIVIALLGLEMLVNGLLGRF